LDQWQKVVLGRLEALNAQFQHPLPHSEIKATAKSIAKWTWRKITPQGLREIIERTHTPEQQRERGRKATNQAEIAPLGGKASGEARWQAKEAQRVTARLMRAAGHSYRAIGEALGVSTMTIYDWLNRGEDGVR